MFYRANPSLTSLPCSCKEIYGKNAEEELFHADECYDLYGHCRYSKITHDTRDSGKSEDIPECSEIFRELRLHPRTKPSAVYEFLEMSPWETCKTAQVGGDLTARAHRKCTTTPEKLSISGLKSADARNASSPRRSMSDPDAVAKRSESYDVVRPYSDSRLNVENSRGKSGSYINRVRNSRVVFPNYKRDSKLFGYKFCHFKEHWKHTEEYTRSVTAVRLQQECYAQMHHNAHGNNSAFKSSVSKRKQAMTAVRDPSWAGTEMVPEPAIRQADTISGNPSKTAAINVSRDPACEQTCYSFKFPNFQTCSFKVARCHVHTDHRRGRKHKPRRAEKNIGGVGENQKLQQMLSDSISTTTFSKDEKNRLQKSTKILQRSKTRDLEIVAKQSPNNQKKKSPKEKRDYLNIPKRFLSPRVVCKYPLVTKQSNFQETIIARKYPTKSSNYPTTQITDRILREYNTKSTCNLIKNT